MSTPFNPAGYPAVEEIDGNLSVKDPSGIGTYGIITADSFIGLTKSIGFLKALAGPDPKHPTVVQLPNNTILPIPLSFYGLTGDDATWINQAMTFAPGSGSINSYLGGFNQTGGLVELLANAVYNTKTDVVVSPGIWLRGNGRGTIIACAHTANGHGIYAHGSQPGGANVQGVGTKISGLTVDASAVTSTIQFVNVDFGDQFEIVLEDVKVQNNTTTGATGVAGNQPLGAVGFNWCNAFTLTEKLFMKRCVAENCGTPNLSSGSNPSLGGGAGLQSCSLSGASTSRMYSEIDLILNQQPGQNGLVIARQGHLMNGRCVIRGNMSVNTSGFNNSGVIVIGVGQAGHILQEYFDVHVETDPGTAGGGVVPYFIYFGSNADNTMTRCFGRLQGLDGFQNSNLSGANGQFSFSGQIFSGNAPGFNALTTPPTISWVSGTAVTYDGIDVMAFPSVSGGTITAVTYNGVALTGAFTGPFFLSGGMTLKFTFTGTLTVQLVPTGMTS